MGERGMGGFNSPDLPMKAARGGQEGIKREDARAVALIDPAMAFAGTGNVAGAVWAPAR